MIRHIVNKICGNRFRPPLIIFFVASMQLLLAQEQPVKILDEVSKKYQSYKTVSASFDYTVMDKSQRKLAESGATLLLDIPSSKYRISMDDRDIISDAKAQWQVMKDIGEVQVSEVNDDPDQLSPATVFSFYKKGYGYSALPDEKEGGKPLYVIRLEPQDKHKPVSYIKLRIDKGNSLIRDVTVFDRNGGSFSYRIKKFETNIKLPASTFVFDKDAYKGMEIVDLR